MRLILVIKIARYTTKAMRSAADGLLGEAHAWMDRLDRVRPLNWPEKGFRSLLYLMQDDYAKAEKEFLSVIEGTASSDAIDDQYAHLFAKAQVASLRGNDDLRRQYEKEAARLNASPSARDWLPLERRP
jgi:hypothetical protein